MILSERSGQVKYRLDLGRAAVRLGDDGSGRPLTGSSRSSGRSPTVETESFSGRR